MNYVVIGRLCLLFVLLIELGFGVMLFLNWQGTRANDQQMELLQDIVRQREILTLRDVGPTMGQAEVWIERSKAPDRRILNELLGYFDSDLIRLKHIIDRLPNGQSYWSGVNRAAQSWRISLVRLAGALNSKDINVIMTTAQTLNSQATVLNAALNSETSGIKNPYLVDGSYLDKQQELYLDFQKLITAALCWNCFLAIAMTAFAIKGSRRFFMWLSNSTSFTQKCMMLVWTPFLFSTLSIGLLALLFYRSASEIHRISTDRQLERKHIEMFSMVRLALPIESEGARTIEASMAPRILELRKMLAGRQQQLEGHDAIVACLATFADAGRALTGSGPVKDAEIARLASTDRPTLEFLRKLAWERALIYIRYGVPETGQQAVLKGKQARFAAIVESMSNLQALLLVVALANVGLASMVAVYFHRAIVGRLELVIENSRRMKVSLPLIPAIGGKDEVARLDGSFHDMANHIYDLTEKERRMIENAGEIICTVNAQQLITTINPAVSQVWGFFPEQMVSTKINEWVVNEDRDRLEAELAQMIRERDKCQLESKVRTSEGELVDMQWSAQWSQQATEALIVLQDVSVRKQTERLKRELISMVSHDLRTPITTMMMVVDLMQTGALGELAEEGQASLERIHLEMEGVVALVGDLLDIEKIDSGKLEFEMEECDLEDILHALLEDTFGEAKERGVGLNDSFDELEFVSDENMLIRALVNILRFLIDGAGAGDIINLEARSKDAELTFAFDVVSSSTRLNLTSDIFDSISAPTINSARFGRLTKLGLALAGMIIQGHKGRCEATGNRVTVALPLPAEVLA